eukprot:TRINITY_DN18435_c0_g1_i1.p1 TRINITY_DN18435_c0_g1~~TRINITY_DN18435_c0_g1_i1.p1  ORF type:complete len:408 (+),score=53.87 TRINITY_DN18435_c0_g1_i1:28-1224(+)
MKQKSIENFLKPGKTVAKTPPPQNHSIRLISNTLQNVIQSLFDDDEYEQALQNMSDLSKLSYVPSRRMINTLLEAVQASSKIREIRVIITNLLKILEEHPPHTSPFVFKYVKDPQNIAPQEANDFYKLLEKIKKAADKCKPDDLVSLQKETMILQYYLAIFNYDYVFGHSRDTTGDLLFFNLLTTTENSKLYFTALEIAFDILQKFEKFKMTQAVVECYETILNLILLILKVFAHYFRIYPDISAKAKRDRLEYLERILQAIWSGFLLLQYDNRVLILNSMPRMWKVKVIGFLMQQEYCFDTRAVRRWDEDQTEAAALLSIASTNDLPSRKAAPTSWHEFFIYIILQIAITIDSETKTKTNLQKLHASFLDWLPSNNATPRSQVYLQSLALLNHSTTT